MSRYVVSSCEVIVTVVVLMFTGLIIKIQSCGEILEYGWKYGNKKNFSFG